MRWRHPFRGGARPIDEEFQRLVAGHAEKPETFPRGSVKNRSGADALLWGVETPHEWLVLARTAPTP